MQPVAVLAAEQQFGDDAVLDHRRGAPLAGDQRVLGEVPPGVVGQVLRAAVGLPGPHHVERVVVEQRDAARARRRRSRRPGRTGRSRPGRSAGCAGGSSRPCSPSSSGVIVLTSRGRAGRAGCRRRARSSCAGRAAAGSAAAARRALSCPSCISALEQAFQPKWCSSSPVVGRSAQPTTGRSSARPGRRRPRVSASGGSPGPVERDHVGERLGRRRGRLGRTAVEGRVGHRRCPRVDVAADGLVHRDHLSDQVEEVGGGGRPGRVRPRDHGSDPAADRAQGDQLLVQSGEVLVQQRLHVRRAGKHRADRLQGQTQRAQPHHLVEPLHVTGVVEPVSRDRAAGRLHQPHLVVVVQRAHGQPRRPCELPDLPDLSGALVHRRLPLLRPPPGGRRRTL